MNRVNTNRLLHSLKALAAAEIELNRIVDAIQAEVNVNINDEIKESLIIEGGKKNV